MFVGSVCLRFGIFKVQLFTLQRRLLDILAERLLSQRVAAAVLVLLLVALSPMLDLVVLHFVILSSVLMQSFHELVHDIGVC